MVIIGQTHYKFLARLIAKTLQVCVEVIQFFMFRKLLNFVFVLSC